MSVITKNYKVEVVLTASVFTDITDSLTRRWTAVSGAKTGDSMMTSATINCDAGSAILNQDTGTWISSIGNISNGGCVITMSASLFADISKVECTASQLGSSAPGFTIGFHTFSGDTVTIDCEQDNAGGFCTSYNASIQCYGVK